jgi:hypothetical protein
MKRVAHIILLVSTASWCMAQAPGYMGHRLTLTAEASLMNALMNPNHNMGQGLDTYSLNVRGTADLDYTVSRMTSVGLTFDVLATGLSFDWGNERYDKRIFPIIGNQFKHARIRGYGYGANVKFFRNPAKGAIAPVGTYTKIDAMLLTLQAIPYSVSSKSEYKGGSHDFLAAVISFTLGQQRVFFNYLILRSAVQVGIVPTGLWPYFGSIDENISEPDQEGQLEALTQKRLFSYYLFNVNVGVGFIIPYRQKVR